MNAAKTTTERVEKLRKDRAASGFKRLELYAHTDDHKRIKEFAAKLASKRAGKHTKER